MGKGPPHGQKGIEACLAITEQGIKLYGNAATFRAIAEYMLWVANSDESEHFSFSVIWDLCELESKGKETGRNVFVLVDEKMRGILGQGQNTLRDTAEVTFMAVEKSDLDELRRYEE